jgi:putative CocE/NonD family hydrolase
MTFTSWALAKMARLRPADSTEVLVERHLEQKMADGTVLLADRWYSPATVQSAPVLLVRSPYGRQQFGVLGRLFAERGYQTLVQSVRGTFDSGGAFDPFRHERADGRATLAWIEEQPWFTGRAAAFGPSYMGLTQWALLPDAPPYLQALALQITASDVRTAAVFPGGSFSLETGAFWVQLMEVQGKGLARYIWAMATSRPRLAPAYRTLPLRDADLATFGHRVGYFQDWLDHAGPGDAWWDSVDFSNYAAQSPPATLLGGWFDLFLPAQIDDYVRLRQAGREARLTVGPWTHSGPGAVAAGVRDTLEWFDIHLGGRPDRSRRDRVRLFVMGSDRWVDVPDWPPPSTPERWYMGPGGTLSPEPPSDGGPPDRYRHDPADPAPGVGGATLDVTLAGSRDQHRREARSDVLVYTSSPLTKEVTVMGPVEAEVWLRSSRPYFDVFVRLCQVDRSGRSRNISDGILRVDPDRCQPAADGVWRIEVRMCPTAMTFKAGHRIRIQVSSAAHPLFARNTGSGEPIGTASRLMPSEHHLYHDGLHPSAITLPVTTL